jgi:hypothetical protein
MFDYPIFPTESFLLGVCIGEYDDIHRGYANCTLRFIEHLKKRLVPFYPDFKEKAKTETRELSDEEANKLDDVTWLKVDEDCSVGWREEDRSRYYIHFRRDQSSVREYRWIGPERRSLVDLLVDFVSPYMTFTFEQIEQWDPRQHPMTPSEARARRFAATFGREHFDITNDDVGEESPRKISVMISKMVDDCGDSRLFETGHKLGELLPLLEISRIEPEWQFEDEEDRQSTIQEWTHEIDRIRKHEVIQKCHYADLALKDLHHFYDLPRQMGETDHMDYLESVWMAIGEILGVLRSNDDEARLADAEGTTPRGLKVRKDMESDMIRRIVRRLEVALINEAGITGEEVIAQTSVAIEALVKRFWGVDTLGDGIWSFLEPKKSKRADKDERHFAWVASHLYGEYRNVSQHNLETHPCTIRDAKYFLNGIHVLLELCDTRLAAQ